MSDRQKKCSNISSLNPCHTYTIPPRLRHDCGKNGQTARIWFHLSEFLRFEFLNFGQTTARRLQADFKPIRANSSQLEEVPKSTPKRLQANSCLSHVRLELVLCLALKHLVFALKSPCCFSLSRFFHRLRADSTPSALRCRRLHPDCVMILWSLARPPDEYATCVYLSAVAKITADSGECEATSRRNANLMGFLSRLVICHQFVYV